VNLALFNDTQSQKFHERFTKERVLERLREIDARAARGGLAALDASDPLTAIGVETDAAGKVMKNSYGVLNLAWKAARNPEWADQIGRETAEIRRRIEQAHGARLRYIVWAGMGGSVEDKSMYNAAGLIKSNPRCYALDSTDPAKLKCILEDMTRTGRPLPDALRSTLVVGMAMGMTSYEPLVNLEKLSNLYAKYGVDARPNFLYMTLPDSLLDRFARERGYCKIELQLDGGNSLAGRHSAPLGRGALYPLALAGVDIREWIAGAVLGDQEIHTAWQLSAFLHAQGEAGRDKVTLALPKAWSGAALWTKQDFEESLGKSEATGIKIVIDEKIKLANYRSPKDPKQDRAFLFLRINGAPHPETAKIALLRRAGYPVASLALDPGAPLSRYMQFIHYAVCGLGVLRGMNFVTQPGVELYKAITSRVYEEAAQCGGVEKCAAWRRMTGSPRRASWKGALDFYYDRLEADPGESDAPAIYASLLCKLAAAGRIEYGELTYFGDTRYCVRGRLLRRKLNRAAENLFRARLHMPVDIYEGPAMNHSYHEMIIGHGKCFSTVIFSEKQERLPAAGYTAGYHAAQFLATKLALEERGRAVAAIVLKDLGERSLMALDGFFAAAAAAVRRRMKYGAI
jgi:glucose-6-phosphate isomerase